MRHKHADLIKANLYRFKYEGGKLVWANSYGPRARKDAQVGCIDTHGYLQVKLDKKMVLVHRIIWAMFHESRPEQVDHINRVRSDNRIENLRASNNTLNQHNTAVRKDNSSGFAGVCFKKETGKWVARISVCQARLSLGSFATAEQAAQAYAEAKVKYHNDHNDPDNFVLVSATLEKP